MFSKRFLSGAALSAFTLIAGNPALAQETTSSLRGLVTDDSGNAISDATVSIVHVPTGTRASAVTNSAGVFDARGLRVGGPYTIEIEAQDYRGQRFDNLNLTLGITERLNVQLEPAETTEEMIVVAAPRPVASGVGSATNLTREDIAAVVSITRDLRDLARRDPLVSQDLGVRGGGGAGGISIGGSAARSNRIAVDGVGSGDDFGLNTSGLATQRGPISLEAVEQFAIEASPLDVENGDFNGGSLTIALRSGTNDFEGSAFVNYRNEGLVGQTIAGRNSRTLETQENYGGFLAGPILKDRLFLALSYEFYESANVTGFGLDSSFANRFNGLTTTPSNNTSAPLTQAEFDGLINSFRTNYAVGSRFQVGTIPLTRPVSDEKYSGKLDWNINDDHRLTYTHRFTESNSTVRNIGQTSVNPLSNWYDVPEEERVNTLQLNSNWTSALSTEVRYSYRDYVRGQVPPLGRDRGQVSVCLEPTGTAVVNASATTCENSRSFLNFGPDTFRQANSLDTSKQEGQFAAEYALGDFLLKAGAQFQQIDIDNLFVPRAFGVYTFDTIAGFNAGEAARLQYGNALTGNASDAAAKFQYTTYAAFAQASWDVSPELTVTGGLRYELYQSDDSPALNPNFRARIGFGNDITYDGLDVIMPRFSAEWQPTDTVEVTGSLGLVSGGVPDVFLSNSFSNTGFVSAEIDVQRTATGCTETVSGRVLSTTDCAVLLSGYRTNTNAFFQVPSVAQALVGAAGAPVLASVNALDQDFEIPSDWRANVSLRWDAREWLRLGFDVLGTVSQEGLALRDGRSVPLVVNGVQQRTPDGRLRYDGLALSDATRASLGTPLRTVSWYSQLGTGATRSIGNGQDLIAYNPDETSWFVTAALSAQVSFANGVDAGLSYVRQESEDYGTLPSFATTATGIYGEQYTSLDPNAADLGRSNNEIEEAVKLDLSWTKAFVGDLKTRFTLFGEWREGYPLNLLQGGGAGRTATYGVSRGDHLLYVPNLNNPRAGTTAGTIVTDDARVVFANQAQYDFVKRVVDAFELPQGAILEKSAVNNPDVSRMDLQISQELPGLRKNHRTLFTVDISNVLNLINDDWGVVREFSNRRAGARVADYVCATAAGVAAGTGSVTCDRYLIQNANTGLLNADINQDNSRWYIQLGLKYEF